MNIETYQGRHFDGVDALWRTCFPNDPPRNQAAQTIPVKLAMEDDLFLVAEDQSGRVIGTTMAGYDGHRGWLYAVAVSPGHQGEGVGKRLVEEACQRLREAGCIKVNLQVRAGNSAVQTFYESLGFAAEERISMGREL